MQMAARYVYIPSWYWLRMTFDLCAAYDITIEFLYKPVFLHLNKRFEKKKKKNGVGI